MLNQTSFAQEMAILTRFYNKALSDPQLEIWFGKVKHCDYFDFCAGINATISESRQFPTPNELLGHVERARLASAQRALQKENREAKNFFAPNAHKSQLARDCVSLLLRRLDEEIDASEYALGLQELEKKYPGIGFGNASQQILKDELERYDRMEKRI